MNLEWKDMAIHAAVALALTMLLSVWGNPWSVATLVTLGFFLREQVQQTAKANPPSNPWLPWKWGPRGIAEWAVTVPAAFGGAYAAVAAFQ